MFSAAAFAPFLAKIAAFGRGRPDGQVTVVTSPIAQIPGYPVCMVAVSMPIHPGSSRVIAGLWGGTNTIRS